MKVRYLGASNPLLAVEIIGFECHYAKRKKRTKF